MIYQTSKSIVQFIRLINDDGLIRECRWTRTSIEKQFQVCQQIQSDKQLIKFISIIEIITESVMRSFDKQYKVVEVIKDYKSKLTTIVTNSHGKYFICKIINVNNAQTINQLKQLTEIKHPNIVAIEELIIQSDKIYVIQEYCEEGDLAFHMNRRNIRKGRYYPQQTIAKWILQAIMGLQYLHNKKICHNDIRLDNVFLTSQGFLKLGSFKLAKSIQKQKGINLAFSLLVSPLYSALQCLQKNICDQKSDMWALGCLLYQLCTLKNNNVVQNAQRVVKGKIQALPLIYSQQLNQIYLSCLQNNPSDRPSAHSLLRNEYFINYLTSIVKKDNNLPSNRRIPIKKYKIHKQNQKKNQIEELKKISIQKKQSGQTTMSSLLLKKPSIDQRNTNMLLKKPSIDQRNKQIKVSSKQDQPYNIKIQAIKQVQKSTRYNFDRKSSIQMRKDRQKLPQIKQSLVRSKSRQVCKRTSLNKNLQNNRSQVRLPNESALGFEVQKSIQASTELGNSIANSNTTINSNQSPKKVLGPPKPPKRKSCLKNSQDNKNSVQHKLVAQLIVKELELSKSQFKQRGKLQQEVKSSMDKVMNNLLSIKGQGEAQQQISFQLDDDDDIRLTSAKNQQQQLVDAYKTKLQQLIKWMQCKYSPNMQTIMQRTLQMDTTTFSNLKL